MASLKRIYRRFMRLLVDKKWLEYFQNVVVLAENFINGKHYVVIFEADNEDKKRTIYLLIENCKNTVKPLEIASFKNANGYIVSNKFKLIGNIPAVVYSKLIENGLFKDIKKAYPETGTGTFGIHRLVLSLYDECLDHKVHHINLKRDFNAINNLVKMQDSHHRKIHRTYSICHNSGLVASAKEQNKLKRKILYPQKNFSNAENPLNVLSVLKYCIQNLNAKTIAKKLNKKIGHTKIQELKNYYFYANDFWKWLLDKAAREIQLKNGNFKKRWRFVFKFDRYIEDENLEAIKVIELLE